MSKYEEFKKNATEQGIAQYRESIKGNGGFDYNEQISSLIQLANKLNRNLFIYLFGEKIGQHFMEKFALECKRDLLHFLNHIDSEQKFFILYELKTNQTLFAHC